MSRLTNFEQEKLFRGNDLLLVPFLFSKDAESAEIALNRLFTEHVDTVCTKIVEFRTRTIFDIDYRERQKLHEDLKQEVRLKMLSHLRKLQVNPNIEPIYDFRSYVARITHNLVHDYFRTKFRPTAVVQSKDFQLPHSEFKDDAEIIEFKNKTLPDFAAEFEDTDERIYRLKCVWHELCLMPKAQSAAWLLKIEDKNNDSTLKWLPIFRIATIREIADVIGQDAEVLAQYWNYLPLSDQQIAKILNSTQRQVINWRKSANERLQRRIKKLLNKQHD
jgi:RNA polymerase sigma factor (sigma-70 family)